LTQRPRRATISAGDIAAIDASSSRKGVAVGEGPSQASELGRFAEPAMLVLVSLSDGPKHGYAIMTDVEAFGGASLGPGTLYAVLARLEAGGLIEPLESDERRRPYRLTAAGAAALADQLAEMGRFLRIGRMRLRGATEGPDR
jgi:DNA-binding PadR family transcriptional regulator